MPKQKSLPTKPKPLSEAQLSALAAGRTAPKTAAQIEAARTTGKKPKSAAQLEALRANRERSRQPNPREWRIWYGMVQRCHNLNDEAFKYYGGRGVIVCDAWRKSFHSFLADMGASEGLELDRINNNGNYEPSNCRWTDRVAQANNRRSNRTIEHEGIILTVAQLSRMCGINAHTLRHRIIAGRKGAELIAKKNLSSKSTLLQTV